MIKPSAAIRKNYNEIAELCRDTGEPIYLTKNGEGDLVVMDIDSFHRREAMLRLREDLLASEQERANGIADYTIEEAAAAMRRAAQEVLDARRQ